MARSARRSTLLCGSVAGAAGCGVKVVVGMPARSPPAALLQQGFTQKVENNILNKIGGGE